jgi:hypothetical protein
LALITHQLAARRYEGACALKKRCAAVLRLSLRA